MDHGHYNCRDYYITPHIAPSTITNHHHLLPRHESFDELEQRSRSPASRQPKFPLLSLPLELRQQILKYVLPYTREFKDSGLLGDHVRNFSAVKKREAKGMVVPQRSNTATIAGASNVVWQRGTVSIMRVNKQLHDECAESIYGSNTFLLFITYLDISFRFRWLLPSGLAPSRKVPILTLLPQRYLQLIKKVVIHVDHVDPYTGMIKFNVQGKGLAAGLKKQLERLVGALQSLPDSGAGDLESVQERRLAKVHVRVSNGNSVTEALKPSEIRLNEEETKTNDDLEDILEPLGRLRGVRDVSIGGAVPVELIERLTEGMTARAKPDELAGLMAERQKRLDVLAVQPPLCVYGNDME